MISPTLFAAAWPVLEDRFRVTHNRQTVLMYQAILSEELNDEEFQRACRAAFRFERFFPEPQALINYGKGAQSFEGRARLTWELAMDRAQGKRLGEALPQSARAVLNRITQGAPLANQTYRDLTFIRKEFLGAYADELRREAEAARFELLFEEPKELSA